MSPIHLQNKIIRMLKELRNACPKTYHNDMNKVKYWVEWIGSGPSIKILNKYKTEYLGCGAARTGFMIKHAGKKYAFKICHSIWAEDVVNKKADDDNHAEIISIEKANKNLYTRTLVLPLVHYFKHPLVGWVTVMPYAESDVDEYSLTGYNSRRVKLMSRLTWDVHCDNIALWGGYVWLIDYNCDYNSNARRKTVINMHRRIVVEKKLFRDEWRDVRKLSKSVA